MLSAPGRRVLTGLLVAAAAGSTGRCAGAPFLPAHPGGGSQTLGWLLPKKSGPCFRQMFSGRAASPGVSGPQATWGGGGAAAPMAALWGAVPTRGQALGARAGRAAGGKGAEPAFDAVCLPPGPGSALSRCPGDCSTPHLLNFLHSSPFPLSHPFPPC